MEQKQKSAPLFDELSTRDLEQLLRNDCDGIQELSTADILAICQILAMRQTVPRSARAAWEQFLHCYAPGNTGE